MSPDKLTLDTELSECLVRAKALAVRDGLPSVTFVHVVRAVVPWKPDLATEALERAGVGRFTAPPPADPLTDDELDRAIAARLALAPDVESTIRRLQRRGYDKGVQLADLLAAMLADPARRLELSLERLGLVPARPGANDIADAPSGPYASSWEYLRDQIVLWSTRYQATQGVRAATLGRTRAEPADELARLRVLEDNRERRYWLTHPNVVREPLGFTDLSREAREILACLYMEEVFDLDDCSFYQPKLRELAQWMAPKRYPANCAAVLAAARCLHRKGDILSSEAWPELVSSVALSAKSVDRLVAAQAPGPITEAELEEFREELRGPDAP